jgi:hypothetical protein
MVCRIEDDAFRYCVFAQAKVDTNMLCRPERHGDRPRGPFSRLCCAKAVAVPELLEMRACVVVDPTPRCWKEAQNGDLGRIHAMGGSW